MKKRYHQRRSLTDLPSHIVLEILSRLPAKTIIHCKSVCKLWLSLIADPHFPALHSSRARPGLVIYQSELFKRFFRIVDFDGDDDDRRDHLPRDTTLKFDLSSVGSFPDSHIVVDGSANGFLLLRDINYEHETLYICNPITREYAALPWGHRAVRYPSVVTHGFGVIPASNEYKVVRIFQERELEPITRNCLRITHSECQVYSLKTGKWRAATGEAPPFAYDSRSLGLFFQGNIHWMVQDFEGCELISCFDLKNEIFEAFPPPFPGRRNNGCRVLGSLGFLKGCLCLCDNSSDLDIEIWVMKEYGRENSWCKEIVVRKMDELVGPSFQIVQVLNIFRDGKVLLQWGDFFMFYYYSKSGGDIEEVDMEQPRGPNSIEAMHYAPTFITLGSLIGLDNVSVFSK